MAAMAPHAGMPQGHPMTTGHPPNPTQVVVSQAPGQVMLQPQQMHGMVSGPGSVQASQGSSAMGGIPAAVSTGAGAGPSAHALSHLNPGQAHLLQQQQLCKSIFYRSENHLASTAERRRLREIVRRPDSVGFVVPSNVGNTMADPFVVFLLETVSTSILRRSPSTFGQDRLPLDPQIVHRPVARPGVGLAHAGAARTSCGHESRLGQRMSAQIFPTLSPGQTQLSRCLARSPFSATSVSCSGSGRFRAPAVMLGLHRRLPCVAAASATVLTHQSALRAQLPATLSCTIIR